MDDEKQGPSYWSGWIAAYVLLAIFLAITAFVGWFSPPYCGDHEAAALCLRSWIEATGGWTTPPAAGVGAWFVIRQIRDASRHHREGAFIVLQRHRAIVLRASRSATELLAQSNVYWHYWDQLAENHAPPTQLSADFDRHIQDLWERLGDQVFDDVERDILAPDTSITALRRSLSSLRNIQAQPGSQFTAPIVLIEKMKRICELVRDYDRNIQSEAKAFFAIAKRILDG